MKRTDDFFNDMKTHFLESDMDSFNEIKEDLLEHIAIQLEEGKTEEEILAALGQPEKLAASFYEDQRLDKALKAETDIVAVEDVKKIYKQDQQIKRKKKIQKMNVFFSVLLVILFSILTIYLISFSIIYAIQERFFAIGPITLAIFLFGLSIYLSSIFRKKTVVHIQKILVISMISLLISGGVYLSGHWFYKGHYYEQLFELKSDSLKEIDLAAEYPIEVSVIPIGEKEAPKIEIQGYIKNADQDRLVAESTQKTAVQIGSNDHFEWLKQMKKSDVIFYLPKNTEFEKLSFNSVEATMILSHLQAKNVNVAIKKGEVRLNDIYAEQIKVDSEKADADVVGFFADIEVNNQQGKTILKEGQGQISVASQTGLINLNDLSSNSLTITNEHGKNVVSSSTIEHLKTSNVDGITVIENQVGDTAIENTNGKIVLTDLRGKLALKNKHGQVIVYEKEAIDGTIVSDTGLVKWIQSDGSDLTFQLSSKSGKISNEFENQKKTSHEVSIATQSGDIRIIKKDEN